MRTQRNAVPWETIVKMKEARKNNASISEIAKQFKISHTTAVKYTGKHHPRAEKNHRKRVLSEQPRPLSIICSLTLSRMEMLNEMAVGNLLTKLTE